MIKALGFLVCGLLLTVVMAKDLYTAARYGWIPGGRSRTWKFDSSERPGKFVFQLVVDVIFLALGMGVTGYGALSLQSI